MAGDTVIKVMTSNALRTVFADLLPAFEQAHNIKVDASYAPAKRVQKRLAAGEVGLDMYGMREGLKKAGLIYVDNPEDV